MRRIRIFSTVIFSLLAGFSAFATEPLRRDTPPWREVGVTLTAVGDVLPYHWPIQGVYRRLSRPAQYAYPFAGVRSQFEGIVFGNLEGPFTEGGIVRFKDKNEPSYFRVPTRFIKTLQRAGFSLVSLANNHLRDGGDRGVIESILTLKKAGIAPLGAGYCEEEAEQPVILERNGLKLGFLGWVEVPPASVWASAERPGGAHAPLAHMVGEVKALKPRVDLVVASLHWGVEYKEDGKVQPPSAQRVEMAHALIDAGAAVVLGHHSHTVERVERYHGGIIFYGLGNFMFGAATREGHPHSIIAKIYLNQAGYVSHTLVPVLISPKQARYQPRVLQGKDAVRVIRWVEQQ